MHGAVHPTWATGAQYIQLVSDLSDAIASSGYFRRYFFGVESAARPSWWRDNRPCVRWLSVVNLNFVPRKLDLQEEMEMCIPHEISETFDPPK